MKYSDVIELAEQCALAVGGQSQCLPCEDGGLLILNSLVRQEDFIGRISLAVSPVSKTRIVCGIGFDVFSQRASDVHSQLVRILDVGINGTLTTLGTPVAVLTASSAPFKTALSCSLRDQRSIEDFFEAYTKLAPNYGVERLQACVSLQWVLQRAAVTSFLSNGATMHRLMKGVIYALYGMQVELGLWIDEFSESSVSDKRMSHSNCVKAIDYLRSITPEVP